MGQSTDGEANSGAVGNCGSAIKFRREGRGTAGRQLQDHKSSMGIEQIDLPGGVTDSCKRLMADFGLRFACIEFAVTSAEEWYFLEINQMGQFLFVEQFAPEIHLLDMFVQLLTRVEPVRNGHYGINFINVAPKAYEMSRKEKGDRAPKLTPGSPTL
jgi:hypothetical protein